MGFVEIKCPNCRSKVQFDDNLEKGFCQYCGAKLINEKLINEKEVKEKNKDGEIKEKSPNTTNRNNNLTGTNKNSNKTKNEDDKTEKSDNKTNNKKLSKKAKIIIASSIAGVLLLVFSIITILVCVNAKHKISTAEQLMKLTEKPVTRDIVLENNITIDGSNFEGIYLENCNVDGQGYTVYINNAHLNGGLIGLFATAKNCKIKNIEVEITLKEQTSIVGSIIGGIVGVAENCEISNCLTKVVGQNTFKAGTVGGVVGISTNTKIKDCYGRIDYSGSCEIDDSEALLIGGIAGFSDCSEIEDCFSNVKWISDTEYDVSFTGLIYGFAENSTVTNCATSPYSDTYLNVNSVELNFHDKSRVSIIVYADFANENWNTLNLWNVIDIEPSLMDDIWRAQIDNEIAEWRENGSEETGDDMSILLFIPIIAGIVVLIVCCWELKRRLRLKCRECGKIYEEHDIEYHAIRTIVKDSSTNMLVEFKCTCSNCGKEKTFREKFCTQSIDKNGHLIHYSLQDRVNNYLKVSKKTREKNAKKINQNDNEE